MTTEIPAPIESLAPISGASPEDLAVDQADLYGIPDRFCPDDEPKAEWAVGKINEARETVARLKRNSAERIKREEERLDFFLTAWTEPLRLYAAANRPKKGQTVYLDNGRLSFTRVARRIKISGDDAEAVALAERTAPDLITIVPAQRRVNRVELAKRLRIVEGETEPDSLNPDGRAIYAVVAATGEQVCDDALEITEAEERFTIGKEKE